MSRLVVVIVTLAWVGRVGAYPQLQLAYDQTCTACHLSPAGGGLLSENGHAVAESLGQLTSAPEFFYGRIGGPKWLVLGGDLRTTAGFVATPEKVLAWFPMQYEGYASAKLGGFRIHAIVGTRPSLVGGNRALTTVWSREHYVSWQQHPDAHHGLYVRIGRFMPVFGLRFVEHPFYGRRYGGTPLYADTYGVNVSYVTDPFEVHATGYLRDPLIDPASHASGGAVYAEVRPRKTFSIGAEAMYEMSEDDRKLRAGATGKLYVPAVRLLLSAELQLVDQRIDGAGADGELRGLLGSVVGSFMLGGPFMLDVGAGHWDPNYRIAGLDRDSIDVNLHYFMDSHLELLLTNRFEMLDQTRGGRSGGYSLIQAHYRL
jgi:hypothetical protein